MNRISEPLNQALVNKDASNKEDENNQLEIDLDSIQAIMHSDRPAPDEAIDKQIIAAAHRQLQSSQSRKPYKLSLWRRWSLPVYAATGFSLSVIAINSLWQPVDYGQMMPIEQTTNVEFDSSEAEQNIAKQESNLVKRELPELHLQNNPPEVVTETPMIKDSSLANEETGSNSPSIYTGTQTSRAAYPEKEAWARKIISYMKDGDLETAKTEIIRFKKAYPGYPIEEQIKALNF